MKFFYFPFLVLCLTLSSCKLKNPRMEEGSSTVKLIPGAESLPLFDANDVSIMFPMDMILNTPELQLKNFVSPSDFLAVIEAGEGNPANAPQTFRGGPDSLDNWKVVALRYDPCAPGAHAASAIAEELKATRANPPSKDMICQAQLRLIAQPFAQGRDLDMTFHVLFRLAKDPSSMLEQFTGLSKIKSFSQTNGIPLTVHPGLKAGNPNAKAALLSFLSVQARPDRVLSIATMGLNDGVEPWVFYANIRGPDGKMIITPIPTVDDDSGVPLKFQALSFRGNGHVIGNPSNRQTFSFPGLPGIARDSILKRSTKTILDENIFSDTNISPLGDEKLSLLHSIDNPEQNHFFTMDCVSCHTSSNLLFRRLAVSTAPSDEKARIKGKNALRFSVPKGVTAFVNFKDAPTQEAFQRPWSVRNFGYFNGRPTIAMRTATETAEVVLEMNQVHMGRKEAGPNRALSLSDAEYQDVEPKLWSCLQFSDLGFDTCLDNSRKSLVTNDCKSPIDLKLDRSLNIPNEVFIMSHGARSTTSFQANLQNLSDKSGVSPLPHLGLGSSPLDFKFFVRHSDTDISNIQMKFDQSFENAVGFRYNMGFRALEQAGISLKWDCSIRKWKGKISYGKPGQTPVEELATLEPRAFLN